MAEILFFLKIIKKYIILIYYLDGLDKCVCSYFSTISELNKVILFETFQINTDTNINCIIFVATDVFSMKINNPDIKLAI